MRAIQSADVSFKNTFFKDSILGRLSGLRGVWAKKMFGGFGLYQEDLFFGILTDGRLFFRADEKTRADYEARGMGPLVDEKGRKAIAMWYFEVPPEVVDNPEVLTAWARKAIDTAGWLAKRIL